MTRWSQELFYDMTTRREVFSLYRTLLSEAKRYPSKKKNGIISDIKVEFREKRSLTAPAKIAQAMELGRRGLAEMRKYSRLDVRASGWNVQLEQDPFGAAGKESATRMARVIAGEDIMIEKGGPKGEIVVDNNLPLPKKLT